MKTLLAVFIAFLVVSIDMSAQGISAPNEKIYEMYEVTKEPSFPGGLEKMYRYLLKINSQVALPKDSITGSKLILSFVIDTSGKLTDIQILKDIGGEFGKNAIAVLNAMPAWIPGEVEGRRVKVKYVLPMQLCFRD